MFDRFTRLFGKKPTTPTPISSREIEKRPQTHRPQNKTPTPTSKHEENTSKSLNSITPCLSAKEKTTSLIEKERSKNNNIPIQSAQTSREYIKKTIDTGRPLNELERNIKNSQFNKEKPEVKQEERKQIMDRNIILGMCNLCKKVPGQFKIPTCSDHKFCSACISPNSSIFRNPKFCDKCYKYLISQLFYKKNELICSSCSGIGKFSDWCKSHSFCDRCYSFFETSHEIKIIENFNCNSCRLHFTTLNVNFKYKNPPIENERIETYENRPIIIPSVSGKVRNKTPVFESSTEVAKILDKIDSMRNRSPIIDKYNDSAINSRRNSMAELIPKCFHCKKTGDIRGFLCNHNLCLECLVYTGISQIDNFFEHFKQDNRIYYVDFDYRCPIRGCDSDICIPTSMILKNLKCYLSRKNKRFEYFRKYESEDFSQWISYLDGISF